MTVDMRKTLLRAEEHLPEPAQAEIAQMVEDAIENYSALNRDGLSVAEYVQLKAIAQRNTTPVAQAEVDAFYEMHGL